MATRLVVLYGASVANDYLMGCVSDSHHPLLVVCEEQSAVGVVRRAWRRRRNPLASRLDKLAFLAFYGAALRRGVDHGLAERLRPQPPVPGLRVAHVDDALAAVTAVRPDVVLIAGTSILSAAWQRVDFPIVNIHSGIAPAYRGRFCWFWPLLEGHPEDVGVTLHRVTARVDAGPIVLQRRLPADALGTLSFVEVLAAVTRLARDLCDEFLMDPDAWLRRAVVPPQGVGRAAYLEPGLGAYFRYVAMRRRRLTGPR